MDSLGFIEIMVDNASEIFAVKQHGLSNIIQSTDWHCDLQYWFILSNLNASSKPTEGEEYLSLPYLQVVTETRNGMVSAMLA